MAKCMNTISWTFGWLALLLLARAFWHSEQWKFTFEAMYDAYVNGEEDATTHEVVVDRSRFAFTVRIRWVRVQGSTYSESYNVQVPGCNLKCCQWAGPGPGVTVPSLPVASRLGDMAGSATGSAKVQATSTLLCFALLSSHFQVKPTHSLHTTTDKLSVLLCSGCCGSLRIITIGDWQATGSRSSRS
jgi:hypothetical protein